MKVKLHFFTLLLLLFYSAPCIAQAWVKKADMPDNQLGYFGATNFVINNSIFVVGGIFNPKVLEYNTVSNTWTDKTAIPYVQDELFGAISFVSNGKAYVGLGSEFIRSSSVRVYKKDLYQYDPATNQWAAKKTFPGAARSLSTYFTLIDKVYVVGGKDSSGTDLDEVWEYNITTDNWQQKTDYIGTLSMGTGFVLGSKGYLTLGVLNAGIGAATHNKTLYEYSQSTDTWLKKADFPADGRYAGISFSINNKAYVGLGATTSSTVSYHKDLYTYDNATNKWSTSTYDLIAEGRYLPFASVISNVAYIGGGYAKINGADNGFIDLYAFNPTLNINNIVTNDMIKLFPNPASNSIVIETDINLQGWNYLIKDITGKEVAKGQIGNGNSIDIRRLQPTKYILTLNSNDRMFVATFVKK